jgi:uncharacterized protein YbbC (DUF1343 family)
MIRAMEACGEAGIEFVVLDRPNPLGGDRVQGPPIEKRWISFVGQVPTPYLHGMTAGELAHMAHGQRWTSARPALTIIKMRGWRRGMVWENTGLRWKKTSPYIPHAPAARYYAATGILGSLNGPDIGIGSAAPFGYGGGKGIDPASFCRTMNGYGLSGVKFSPYQSTTKEGWAGAKLSIHPNAPADIPGINLYLIYEINRRVSRNLFSQTTGNSRDLFNKIYGSSSLESDLRRGPDSVVKRWGSGHLAFRKARAPYLLYA